jgi:hypothetical protein
MGHESRCGSPASLPPHHPGCVPPPPRPPQARDPPHCGLVLQPDNPRPPFPCCPPHASPPSPAQHLGLAHLPPRAPPPPPRHLPHASDRPQSATPPAPQGPSVHPPIQAFSPVLLPFSSPAFALRGRFPTTSSVLVQQEWSSQHLPKRRPGLHSFSQGPNSTPVLFHNPVQPHHKQGKRGRPRSQWFRTHSLRHRFATHCTGCLRLS